MQTEQLKYNSNIKLFECLDGMYKESTGHTFNSGRHYKKGNYLFREGYTPKGVYFIKKGKVKLYQTVDDWKEQVLRMAFTNDIIGYVSLLKQNQYTSSAVALEESDIIFIPKPVFLKALQTDIYFAQGVIKLLCERLIDSKERVLDLITKTVRQRLGIALLSFEPTFEDGKIRLLKRDIASIIGTSNETLSRQLAILQESGLVNLADSYIEIVDHEQMIKYTQLED